MKRIVLFLFLLASLGYAEDYQIKMQRADKKGDRTWIEVTATESTKMQLLVGGQVEKKQDTGYTAKLDGTLTVLEVDKTSQSTKISVMVDRCVKLTDGNSVALLQKGDEVVVYKQDGKTAIQVGGKPAEESIYSVLKDILSVHEEGRPSDDEMFGTAKKVKVGDEWPMNVKMAMADIQKLGAKEENVTGMVQLNRIVEDGGEKCQDISGNVKVTDIAAPIPGLKVEKAEMTMAFMGFFPLDLSKGKTSETEDMKMEILGSGVANRNGQDLPTNFSMTVMHKRSIRYKKL